MPPPEQHQEEPPINKGDLWECDYCHKNNKLDLKDIQCHKCYFCRRENENIRIMLVQSWNQDLVNQAKIEENYY